MPKVNEWNLKHNTLLHWHHQTKHFQYIEKFNIARCPKAHAAPYNKINLKHEYVLSVLESDLQGFYGRKR